MYLRSVVLIAVSVTIVLIRSRRIILCNAVGVCQPPRISWPGMITRTRFSSLFFHQDTAPTAVATQTTTAIITRRRIATGWFMGAPTLRGSNPSRPHEPIVVANSSGQAGYGNPNMRNRPADHDGG